MPRDGLPQPALSVLVLNHNYARFLPECLDSILAQSFDDYEIIVIDDVSTDDSAAILRTYESEPRVRVVLHDVNRGFVASLVEGTGELSNGEFLTVVSADDFVLERDAFSLQVAKMRADANLVACLSAYTKIGPGEGRSVRRPLRGDCVIAGDELIRSLLTAREFTILQTGTIVRAEAYLRAGGYRQDLDNYVDLAMWVALGHAGPVAYTDRPLYGYRVHAAQLSGSSTRRREVLREGLALLRQAARSAQAAGIDVRPSKVLRARISDLALADAFAGRRVRALQRCADAAAIAPLAALTASGWWIALVRSIAGARGWDAIVRIRRRMY
ncbi:MAG: glycosyltransferase family A protein [Tepidiformaceae bacterium]